MKIPDSWDRFSSVSALIKKSTGPVHIYPSSSSRYGAGVDVDVDHYAGITYWQHLLNKYNPKESGIVNNIKGAHE